MAIQKHVCVRYCEWIEQAERKEELQKEIKDQIELGGSGLDEQDRYLLEINLGDLETSMGEDQYYWLIAIRAARADRILRRQQQESVTGERTRKRRAYYFISTKYYTCYMQDVKTLNGH